MEILNLHNGKISSNAVYQSPIEEGQHMIARPRVDESGDAVTPCGVFTNSKGSPRRAVYLQDPCEHDGRAPFVEFESLCGLDISIPSPRDGKLKITVHAGRNMSSRWENPMPTEK